MAAVLEPVHALKHMHTQPNSTNSRAASVLMPLWVGLQEFKEKANPLQAVMEKLGSGLVKLGEDVTSAGSHLGGMFVGLGNNLRGSM